MAVDARADVPPYLPHKLPPVHSRSQSLDDRSACGESVDLGDVKVEFSRCEAAQLDGPPKRMTRVPLDLVGSIW